MWKFWVLMMLKLCLSLVVCNILKFFWCVFLKWKLLLIIRNFILSFFISYCLINDCGDCVVNWVLNWIYNRWLIFCVFSSWYFFVNGLMCVGVVFGVKIFFGCGLNIIIVVGSFRWCVCLMMFFNIVWWFWWMLLNLLMVNI